MSTTATEVPLVAETERQQLYGQMEREQREAGRAPNPRAYPEPRETTSSRPAIGR
jgi:hypothetical protein